MQAPTIQTLIQQLDAIKHIAEAGYWLTTEEICLLLSFDPAMVVILKAKELNFSFLWRNYIFIYISLQGNSQCWQIQQQSKVALPTLANAQVELANPVLPSVCVQIDQFLSQELWQKLYAYAIAKEKTFVSTTTSTDDPDYRRSQYLPYFPEFSDLMIGQVKATMPDVIKHLNLNSFEITQVEAQLTAHNDGNYYKIHNDNGSPDTATRELTYVYYFCKEPKAFEGGELVVYDSKIENNFYVAAESSQTIQPRNNSIVFFLSRYMHEVLPIKCPSQKFADSRFTINGWVRR
jgi:Rps23 Pro-64 3,4-dihydroxylase Tpa1-like proline 4-hydroxylase